MGKRVWSRFFDFSRELGRTRVDTYASSCAFYLFLSLVPIVILLCSILPLTRITQESLLSFVGMYLPDYMDKLVEQIIQDVYTSSAAALPLSLLATLWSAGKALSALIRGIEEVYDDPHRDNYFRRRFLAIVYTLVLLSLFLLGMALMIFGERLQNLIVSRFPMMRKPLEVLVSFRYLISVFLLAFTFCLLYKWIPSYKLKLTEQFPGAAFASAAWVIFTFLFTYFVNHLNGYSTYGSLATIIIVMLWMYYGMYFILLGGYINFYWDTRIRGARHSRIRTQRLM